MELWYAEIQIFSPAMAAEALMSCPFLTQELPLNGMQLPSDVARVVTARLWQVWEDRES